MKKADPDCLKRRIVVAVSDDLLTDQRVQRACDTMHTAGYEVLLVGRAWPDRSPLRKPYQSVKMRLLFRRSPLFYAEFNMRLFMKLLFTKADVFYANDSDTLLAVGLAARLRRRPFVFDGHELFPDVPELVGKPFVRKVWRWIERRFIPKAAACITVNKSVADEYRRRYGVEFGVVRNLSAVGNPGESNLPGCSGYSGFSEDFNLPETLKFKIQQSKFLLYQGAVNKGRCIKELIDAMEFLPDYRFVIAGGGDLLDAMKRYAVAKPYSERVEFTGRIKPDELRKLTPQASLGFCLMENMGLNYYLSLPNRIGDYAAAGVPVLGNDFPEIKRVIDRHHIGTFIGEEVIYNPQKLAAVIDKTVKEWASMIIDERQARFASAGEDMSWKNEQKKLLAYIDTIFVKNLS